MQSTLAEQAELLRSELQGCLARVESFLVSAQVESFLVSVETTLGRSLVGPDVSLPSELYVSSTDDVEANLYGCLSPRSRPCPSRQPFVLAASASKDIIGVRAPVMEIMPELCELCGEPASQKVVRVGDKVVAAGVLSHVPVAAFAQKLCDFIASLKGDSPGFGKTIGCLLMEKAFRDKSKKGGASHQSSFRKEKSFKNKIKKSGVTRKASAAA